MDKPMVVKVVGIITLIQLGMSTLIALIGGFRVESSEINGGYAVLAVIIISAIIMIAASILLLKGNRYGRMFYLIGTIMTLTGNVAARGVEFGLQASLIPLLFTVLLYAKKSAREYYKEIK